MIEILKINLKRFLFLIILIYLLHEILIFLSGASPITTFIVSLREQGVATSYLHAGQANIKSLGIKNTKKWLCHLLKHEGLSLFFIQKNGAIISCLKPQKDIINLKKDLNNNVLHSSVFKYKGMIIVYNNPGKKEKSLLMATKSANYNWFKPLHLKGVKRIFFTMLFSAILLFIFFYFIGNPLIYIRKKIHLFSSDTVSAKADNKPQKIKEIQLLDDSFMKMSKDIEKVIENKQGVLEMISHEIRSPLARQKAALNLIIKNIDVEKNIARANKENINISNLIREIFSYIKVNQKKLKPNYSAFNLNNMIDDMIEDLNYEYDANNITFIENNTLTIRADITLLSIAIQNVISNALKYSGIINPITVTLSEKDNLAMIIVSDNGPGVSQENLETIFEPFFRALDNVNAISGTGLGLSFTKKVIELHQGKVFATINKNNGLTISITLPTKNPN